VTSTIYAVVLEVEEQDESINLRPRIQLRGPDEATSEWIGPTHGSVYRTRDDGPWDLRRFLETALDDAIADLAEHDVDARLVAGGPAVRLTSVTSSATPFVGRFSGYRGTEDS
jgi:hypothetical protein